MSPPSDLKFTIDTATRRTQLYDYSERVAGRRAPSPEHQALEGRLCCRELTLIAQPHSRMNQVLAELGLRVDPQALRVKGRQWARGPLRVRVARLSRQRSGLLPEGARLVQVFARALNETLPQQRAVHAVISTALQLSLFDDL